MPYIWRFAYNALQGFPSESAEFYFCLSFNVGPFEATTIIVLCALRKEPCLSNCRNQSAALSVRRPCEETYATGKSNGSPARNVSLGPAVER